MEYVILWILCGIVAAAIYSQKGRSGGVGLLGGFMLGPIGVILALISSKNEKGIEQKKISSGLMKKCPYCAEVIKAEATVCRYCGKEMPAVVEVEPKQSGKWMGDHWE